MIEDLGKKVRNRYSIEAVEKLYKEGNIMIEKKFCK